MTIDKAIKLLRTDIDTPGEVDILDVHKAEELGIEALKSVKHSRSIFPDVEVDLLPGETKD